MNGVTFYNQHYHFTKTEAIIDGAQTSIEPFAFLCPALRGI